MRINSFGEFNSFVIARGLQNTSVPISNFTLLVKQYTSVCNCKKNTKAIKAEECNKSYINIVNSVLPTIKAKLFNNTTETTIEFYYNQSMLIGTISK
jgi:hypothetical protein